MRLFFLVSQNREEDSLPDNAYLKFLVSLALLHCFVAVVDAVTTGVAAADAVGMDVAADAVRIKTLARLLVVRNTMKTMLPVAIVAEDCSRGEMLLCHLRTSVNDRNVFLFCCGTLPTLSSG